MNMEKFKNKKFNFINSDILKFENRKKTFLSIILFSLLAVC